MLVSICVCFSGSCVVRDASGMLNNTLSSSSSSEECVGLACQYGWDFSKCIKNNTCIYGISNYYQVITSTHTLKTQHFFKCAFTLLSVIQYKNLLEIG